MTRLPESVQNDSTCCFLHTVLMFQFICIPSDHRRRSFPLEQPPIRDLIDMTDEIGAAPPQQQRSRAAASVQAGWQSDPRPAGSPTRTVMYREVCCVAIPSVLSVSVWFVVCACVSVCVSVCVCVFVCLSGLRVYQVNRAYHDRLLKVCVGCVRSVASPALV